MTDALYFFLGTLTAAIFLLIIYKKINKQYVREDEVGAKKTCSFMIKFCIVTIVLSCIIILFEIIKKLYGF